jgi:hypothetical protein
VAPHVRGAFTTSGRNRQNYRRPAASHDRAHTKAIATRSQ